MFQLDLYLVNKYKYCFFKCSSGFLYRLLVYLKEHLISFKCVNLSLDMYTVY